MEGGDLFYDMESVEVFVKDDDFCLKKKVVKIHVER